MNNIAVRVSNLSKCYHIYDRPQDRLKQLIVPKLRSLVGRKASNYFREFWALNDVSFEVGRGETIGIIGRNGSGKSTLLQMICGTLEPTSGSVETRGRVAALLELGAGFNPEFTGRENVYMNATVLGLTQEEIQARFDEIAAFADIGDFIGQPVKHYSSGMYARLAFAVAINVDPNILIVDEALSVGDESFQRKCFARIEEIKRNGATIIFVSHSSSTIVALCDKAILIHDGKWLYTGSPKTAVSSYQKLMNAPEKREQIVLEIANIQSNSQGQDLSVNHVDYKVSAFQENEDDSSFDIGLVSKSAVIYEPNGALISAVRVEALDGRIVNILQNGKRYRICYQVKLESNLVGLRVSCAIKTTTGVEFGGAIYPPIGEVGLSLNSDQLANVSLEFSCNLNPGTYFFNCGISGDFGVLHRIIDASAFRVLHANRSCSFGAVDFNFTANIQ
jgi:lipopolysaccharide transport system ATP-binding protein